MDGLIKHKISDQTVQVWLNSCQRGKSYEARPVEIMFDLTSLSQYSSLVLVLVSVSVSVSVPV